MLVRHLSSAILIFLLLDCFQASAQYSFIKKTKYVKGYVVYNSGDSVEGYIARPDRNAKASVLNFKKGDLDQATYKINPVDIKRYVFGHQRQIYVSQEIPLQGARSLGFVRLIMDGPYPVYYYEFLRNQHILIKAPDGKLNDLIYPPDYDVPANFPMGENKFIHTLKNVFSGNDALLEGITTIKPDKRSILNYLSSYYNKNNIPYKFFDQRQFSLKCGIIAGLGIDWMNWNPIAGSGLRSVSVAPSVGVNLAFYDIASGLGVLAENIISYDSFHFSYSFDNAGITKEFRETFIKTATNNFRLGFSWNQKSGSRIPLFFQAGGSLLSFLNPRYDNYNESLDLDTKIVDSFHDNNVLLSAYYLGGFLRTGLSFRLAKGFLTASLGGSYMPGTSGDKLASVIVGIQYQLNLK